MPDALRTGSTSGQLAGPLPAVAGTLQKMKGISILVDRLYSGYESGKRPAMKRSSAMAL